MATTQALIFDIIARDNASRGFAKAGAAAQGATKPVSRFSSGLKSAAGAMGLAVGASAALAFGLKALNNAAADDAAQRKLAIALRNTTGATQDQIAAVEEYIYQTSLATGVADDELRPAFQRLAQATGDVDEAQRQLSIAMDVSAGTGKSLKTVTEALMKANNGTTASLSRLGLKTKDAEGNTLSLNDALAIMASTFSGQAAAAADSYEGRMNQLRVRWDEAVESLGGKLLPAAEDFSGWLLESGIPAAEGFASAVGDMLAPLGGVAQLLGSMAKGLASSPIGPPLLAGAAGLAALGGAGALYGKVMGSSVIASTRLFIADLKTMSSVGMVAWARNAEGAAAYAASAGRVKGALGGLGKGAAIVGGLALATSGLGDKMHLTNTLTLASMGLLAGPWGAAVGAGVGLIMDFAGGHDEAAKASQNFISTLDAETGALTKASAAWVTNTLEAGGFLELAGKLGVSTSEMVSAVLDGGKALDTFDAALVGLGSSLGPVAREDIQALRAGVSDTSKVVAESRGEFERTGGAVDGLGNAYDKTASKADRMKAAIEDLNNFLDRRGSWRAYQESIDDARDALKKNGRTLNEHTAKGRANAAALDDMIREAGEWSSTLKAGARDRFATQARADILDAARKMGASDALLSRLRAKLKLLNGQRANMYVVTHYSTTGDATPRGFGSGTSTGSGSTGGTGGRGGDYSPRTKTTGGAPRGRMSIGGTPLGGGSTESLLAQAVDLLGVIAAKTGDTAGRAAYLRTGI